MASSILTRVGNAARAASIRYVHTATPVLISGGGPAGLVTALSLGRHGVPCVLVEPREAPSQHPRAHVLSARSVEICASLGVDVGAGGPPLEYWRRFLYCDAVDGRDLGVADHGAAPSWTNLSGEAEERVAHVSQPVFEAALRAELSTLPCVDARYGRRVERVTLDRGGADVELDDGSGVRSRRLVAADGFPGVARRAVAAAAGPDVADRVADLGHHDAAPALQHFVSVAFESRSLAERLLAGGRAAMLYFVFNQKTISVVVAHDLRKGTFNLQYPFFPPAERGAERPGDAAAPRRVRAEVADIARSAVDDLVITSARPWLMRARLADRFALGDVAFLAGDAAHEMPPSGGFGLNTAVGDGHNLGWKLARAHGGASTSLLDTYASERRPAAAANAALALDNWRRGLAVPAALGLAPRAIELASTALAATGAAALLAPAATAARTAALATAAYPDARVASVLAKRADLPLFFPHHDLGLRYDGASATAAAAAAVADARPPCGAKAYVARVAAGERLPRLPGVALDPTRYALLALGDAGNGALLDAAKRAAAGGLLADLVDVAAAPARDGGDAPTLALVRPDRYVAATWRGPVDAADLKRDLLAATFSSAGGPGND